MRRFLTLWRRECMACFLSPVAYVTMVLFYLVASFTFFAAVLYHEGEVQSLNILLYSAILLWSPVLVTVICMRLFAEERRTGTLEPLMTAPVTEWEVVLGKYAGAMLFVLVVLSPVAGNLFFLALLSPGITVVDWGAWLAGGVGTLLMTGLFVAVGTLISLFTRNQIVAALSCFAALWMMILFGHLLEQSPIALFYRNAEWFAVVTHLERFARGLVDTRLIVQYLSLTVLMLFVSVRVLETRRWL
ncbi:MAG: hypothetical protein A2269_07055 [Lentisphaerae bacterium RIFOXYA12_FULL_60_10]|nr:MAG: hypothetical protein A2269_07055 [Lentisphaerae bacterium RIFOXYA12_FULL_60_10]